MYEGFNSKILLFGEYSIIEGSSALVSSLMNFSGSLDMPLDKEINYPELKRSNRELLGFLEYLTALQDKDALLCNLDTGHFKHEIEKGLFFRSSIPREYGAGSSAALVASVYDAFCFEKINRDTDKSSELQILRKVLAQMESHFHGSSSGIDPVCCYTGRTILLDKDSIRTTVIPHLTGERKFFLLDAGSKGETRPLVASFRESLRDPEFDKLIHNNLFFLVDKCIRNLESGSFPEFSDSFLELSTFQLENFRQMIPSSVRRLWEKGIHKNLFMMKLCGSGGGGYFLGYTELWNNVNTMLKRQDNEILPLDL